MVPASFALFADGPSSSGFSYASNNVGGFALNSDRAGGNSNTAGHNSSNPSSGSHNNPHSDITARDLRNLLSRKRDACAGLCYSVIACRGSGSNTETRQAEDALLQAVRSYDEFHKQMVDLGKISHARAYGGT